MKHWLSGLSQADIDKLLVAFWAVLFLGYGLVFGFVAWRKRSTKPVRPRIVHKTSTFCRNQQGRQYERT
jgi:hypothetical protein